MDIVSINQKFRLCERELNYGEADPGIHKTGFEALIWGIIIKNDRIWYTWMNFRSNDWGTEPLKY